MFTEGNLKCKEIRKGMFSDEFAIVIDTFDGLEASFFVPKDKVVDSEKIVHVQINNQGDFSWVKIPTEQPTFVPVLTSSTSVIHSFSK